MSFIFHLKLLKLFFQNKVFSSIPTSAADAAAVNPGDIKTILANGLITFFINGNPVFNNGVCHEVCQEILQIE